MVDMGCASILMNKASAMPNLAFWSDLGRSHVCVWLERGEYSGEYKGKVGSLREERGKRIEVDTWEIITRGLIWPLPSSCNRSRCRPWSVGRKTGRG